MTDFYADGRIPRMEIALLASAADKRQWPTISNGADSDHDIDFSAGKIPDSLGNVAIVNESLTKRIDSPWAPSTGNGGLFSGTVAPFETYHLFLIVKDSDGTVDAGFDTDPVAANIPVGYTTFRRIASLYTEGSPNFVQFIQSGDEFTLDVPVGSSGSPHSPGVPELNNVSVPTGLTTLKASVVVFLDWNVAIGFGEMEGFANSALSPALGSAVGNRAQLRVSEGADKTDDFATVPLHIPVGATPQVRTQYDGATGGRMGVRLYGWTDDRG